MKLETMKKTYKYFDQFEQSLNNGADTKNLMWMVFSMVRGQIEPNDYHYILYLFILQKEEISLYSEFDKNQTSSIASNLESNDSKKSYLEYLRKEFHPIKMKLDNVNFPSIYDIVSKFNFNSPGFDFGDAFDFVLHKLSELNIGFQESVLPKEISKLVIALAGDLRGKRIYNPFSGLNSFGVYASGFNSFYGQEINQKSFIVGQMRSIAHNKFSTLTIKEEDSILEWHSINDGYDFIISNPPLALKIFQDRFYGQRLGPRNCESFLISKSFDELSDKGKMILVISQRFLFSSGLEKQMRQNLINQGWIETIITLPAGLLLNTAVPLIVMVINKKNEGGIHFLNAEKFVKLDGDNKILNENEIISIILNKNESKDSIIVSNEKVIEQDYNLFPSRYFDHNDILLEGELLSSILEPVVRQQDINNNSLVKFVKIESLKNDSLDFYLDIDSIPLTQPSGRVLKIDKDVLLLSSRWKALKPTYFVYSGTPIYLSNDIIAFNVKLEMCDLEYLINELSQDAFNKQVQVFRTGIVVPTIKTRDLLSIKIKLPKVEIQKEIVIGLKEAKVKLSMLEAEKKAQAYGLENLLYENNVSLKHSLGTPLINISSAFNNIISTLDKQYTDWKEINVSKISKINIENCISSVFTNLDLIHTILENIKGIDMSQYKLSSINIIDFINNYKIEIDSTAKQNVTNELIISDELYFDNNRGVLVNANLELLKIAMNFIIDNANRHAFIDDSQKYTLKIILSLHKDAEYNYFVKFKVSNNGKSFPVDFGLEQLVRLNTFSGATGNTGIGGHDLNEIIKHFNSGKTTFDLEKGNESGDEFITSYIFLIPILIFDEDENL